MFWNADIKLGIITTIFPCWETWSWGTKITTEKSRAHKNHIQLTSVLSHNEQNKWNKHISNSMIGNINSWQNSVSIYMYLKCKIYIFKTSRVRVISYNWAISNNIQLFFKKFPVNSFVTSLQEKKKKTVPIPWKAMNSNASCSVNDYINF